MHLWIEIYCYKVVLASHPLAFLLSSVYRVFVGLSKSRLKASWADIIRKQGGSSCVYRIKVEVVEGHGKVSGRHTLFSSPFPAPPRPSPPLPSPPLSSSPPLLSVPSSPLLSPSAAGAMELQWARESQGEVGGAYKMQISRPHPPIQCSREGLRGAHF